MPGWRGYITSHLPDGDLYKLQMPQRNHCSCLLYTTLSPLWDPQAFQIQYFGIPHSLTASYSICLFIKSYTALKTTKIWFCLLYTSMCGGEGTPSHTSRTCSHVSSTMCEHEVPSSVAQWVIIRFLVNEGVKSAVILTILQTQFGDATPVSYTHLAEGWTFCILAVIF